MIDHGSEYKSQSYKTSRRNIADYLHDLGWGWWGETKAKKKNLHLIKIKTLFIRRNIINKMYRQAIGQETISAKHVRERTGILNIQNDPKTQ